MQISCVLQRSTPWASEESFTQRRGANSGEISFYPLETKKTALFAKTLI